MLTNDTRPPESIAHIAFLSMLTAIIAVSPAAADDRVVCQQGARIKSGFVRNASHFLVRVSVVVPGGAGYTINSTNAPPPGTKCPASGAVTFLAEASTDDGRTYHRVMSRTRAQTGGTWLVEVAPDSFKGNFDYSAQFNVQIKPSL